MEDTVDTWRCDLRAMQNRLPLTRDTRARGKPLRALGRSSTRRQCTPMRHRFHALCPYFAMFPEQFVEHWIAKLTNAGDLVLDPFCGRGKTPFQAILMGRRALASDINPVAFCVTAAKTRAPALSTLKRRIKHPGGRL